MLKSISYLSYVMLFVLSSSLMAVRCFTIIDPEDCTLDESGECYWNYGEGACRLRFNSPKLCVEMPNYDSCVISFGCLWNNEGLICESMWDNGNGDGNGNGDFNGQSYLELL